MISVESQFTTNLPLDEYLTEDACTDYASVESQLVTDLHAANNTGAGTFVNLRIHGGYFAENWELTSTPVNVNGENPLDNDDGDSQYIMRHVDDGAWTDIYLVLGDTTDLSVDTYYYTVGMVGREDCSDQTSGASFDTPVWIVQRT